MFLGALRKRAGIVRSTVGVGGLSWCHPTFALNLFRGRRGSCGSQFKGRFNRRSLGLRLRVGGGGLVEPTLGEAAADHLDDLTANLLAHLERPEARDRARRI